MALLVLLCVNIAYAQSPLETVLEPLAELNIPDAYEEYHIGVDFIIYLLIFGGVLNATASDKFGKPATVGLALALSIAMIVFESRQGFALGDFWYVAILALVASVVGLIYQKVKNAGGQQHNWTFISIGYIAAYIILREAVGMTDFLLEYAWLHMILQIILVVAIFYLVARGIEALSTKQ